MIDWVIQNKEVLKIVYGLLITLICFFIVLKSNKFFKLSFHQGIRYFRNAFFFYGLAFAFRYFIGAAIFSGNIIPNYPSMTKALFEFFLIMAGFFLLYSLIWKKIETTKGYFSSFFNPSILIFYMMTFILIYLDYLWKNYYFLFISQIFLFLLMSVISGINYAKKRDNKGFLKFYFLAMILGFISWILNGVISLFLSWNSYVLIVIYSLNIIIFFLFLYGIIKVTKK